MKQLLYKKSLIMICLVITLQGYGTIVSPYVLRSTSDVILVGDKIQYIEDKTGELTINDILKPEYQNKFVKHKKGVFSKPATSSTFWIKCSLSNLTDEDAWLEIGSTNAWYINFFTPDSWGGYVNTVQTGTMRPDSTKTYDVNLFWLPVNKAFDKRIKTYYIQVKSGFIFDLPMQLGTIKALYKQKSKNDFFVAAFIGLMVIMFLYNLFLYYSLNDRIYIYYLGYLFLMALGMPFVNNFPFIQNIEFLFIDKAWWHNNYVIWSAIAYFFIGKFCIEYLELKNFAKKLEKVIRIEMLIMVIILPVISIIFRYPAVINLMQLLTLIFYFTCIYAGFKSLKRKTLKANYFVIGWSALVFCIFIFSLVKNGFLQYNIFTGNILYLGIGIEVTVFSLALGKRLNVLQNENLRIVKNQNEKLEAKVKERTKQLDDLNSELTISNTVLKVSAKNLANKTEKLKKLNETKNKLFATVSHELQSPLITMQNLIQMAENKVLDMDTYSELMAKIKGDAEHIHYTLNNILHWAMTQMKGVKINAETIFLNQVVKENIELFQEMALQKKIELVNNISDNCKVFADVNILNLVFRNLINNALKFTPAGGRITIETKFMDNFCKISVTDTGIGMTPDQIDKMFDEELIQSEKGTKGEKGTGLGLMLCKEFINKSNGELWIRSELNKGSSFYFTLPLN